MSGRLMKYSTKMPDGQVLEFDPGPPPIYRLDGDTITEEMAAAVWSGQDESWQRGRTLKQALDSWVGRLS